MVAKMLGILPNCFVSPSKVSRTSGAAFSFTSGLTMAMRHLLICEGITWSQESIPNAAQLGTDTGIPTSLTNSPRQRTKDGRQAGSNSANRVCRDYFRFVGKPEVMVRGLLNNFRIARQPTIIVDWVLPNLREMLRDFAGPLRFCRRSVRYCDSLTGPWWRSPDDVSWNCFISCA